MIVELIPVQRRYLRRWVVMMVGWVGFGCRRGRRSLLGWGWIGQRFLRVCLLSGWRCRLMRFSGAGSGWLLVGLGSLMWAVWGWVGLSMRCWVRWFSSRESGGVVLTGRLSLGTQSWLADHAVAGVVLFPGAGFVELVLRAGDEVGATVVQELTLMAPLVLVEGRSVQVQVAVGGSDESGGRAVSVYARGSQLDSEWVLHAQGVLAVDVGSLSTPLLDLSVWPPVGAEPVPVTDAYEQLSRRGYQYGPAFQGLQAVWRRGHDVFAEVVVPESLEVAGMGIHPALLDAALHALAVTALIDSSTGLYRDAVEDFELRLPFAWQQVCLHGVGATWLRVHIAINEDGTVGVQLADPAGAPVLTGALTTRPIGIEQLQAALHAAATRTDSGLLEVVWTPVTVKDSLPRRVLSWADQAALDATDPDPAGADVPDPAGADVVVWELPSGVGDVVGAVYAATHAVLAVLQSWLATERAGVLVVLTHGAVGSAGADVTDLAGAAVWGMVRSAQSEHPGRIVLVDTDTDTGAGWDSGVGGVDLAALVGADEPQIVVRAGVVYGARLTPMPPALETPAGDVPWRLAVGGAGTLDDLVLLDHSDVQQPLQPGQVRVAVRAAGVNFRDVLVALGMYPDQAAVLGGEGAGVVLEVGAGVVGCERSGIR